MAKFNQTNTIKTTNRSGHVAYRMEDKAHLVTSVLTTMFNEQKFYGSTDGDIVRLATECARCDPEFLVNLTYYARNIANLRSVSHVLACIIAREAHEYTRKVIRNIVIRPDDLTEIFACYKKMYGKPFPNALKREAACQMKKFSEYQLAKYNGGNKEIKLRDILRITHPHPDNREQAELFDRLIANELETPYTWETELSTKGNTREVWDALIESGMVGYMAQLRNLRNIVKVASPSTIDKVLNQLGDTNEVERSRQLPYRFYNAYKMLKQESEKDYAVHRQFSHIHQTLDKAITVSTSNMDKIPGRTLIAIDGSGSMQWSMNQRTATTYYDIAYLFGMMATKLCEDCTVLVFTSSGGVYSGNKGYKIIPVGKYDSILDFTESKDRSSGGTDMSIPIRWMLQEDGARDLHPFDRVIYLSDNECNNAFSTDTYYRYGVAIQEYINTYRKQYNENLWVHAIDLQGYGTQQFNGARTNIIAGWHDDVLKFISLAENGMDTLVEYIAQLEMA